jgi:hypothetical protein
MSKLDVAGVQQPLTELAIANLEKLEVFSSIASTNTYLMSQPAPAAGRFRVAIADPQTSGRGRHYRRWLFICHLHTRSRARQVSSED